VALLAIELDIVRQQLAAEASSKERIEQCSVGKRIRNRLATFSRTLCTAQN